MTCNRLTSRAGLQLAHAKRLGSGDCGRTAAAVAAVARQAQEAALRGGTCAAIVEVLIDASAAMAALPRCSHESDRERAGRVLPCAQIAAIINQITTRWALSAGRRGPRAKAPPGRQGSPPHELAGVLTRSPI